MMHGELFVLDELGIKQPAASRPGNWRPTAQRICRQISCIKISIQRP
jgi:hypothetical protein